MRNCKIPYAIFLFLTLISESIFSQSLDKLTESIVNYDYYHTLLYSRKLLKNKKKLSAASYAIAYVYYQKFQPFHHLDSADKYIHLSIINYPQKPYITKYLVIDSAAIYKLYDSITYAQFQKIKYNIQPYVYDQFISQHPFVRKELKEIIRKHQYQKIIDYAQTINKSDTTFYLITQYPQHPSINYLYQLLDKQIYLESTQHHTAAEYLLFLRQYSKSSYREMALQNLLDIYIKEKNTAGLLSYAREFSKDKFYSEQAWKWLFAYTVKRFNTEELEKFMQEYPDFPFKQEVIEEMEMASQILIPLTDTTGMVGFIDTSGRFIIPPIYDAVTSFKENVAVVFLNDTAYFINKKNQKIFQKGFQDAYPFFNGYAPVYDGNHWYFVNRLGVKQSEEFEWLSELSPDNNYLFKQNGKYGLCDYKGQIILNAQFEKLGDFENHLAYYVENNLYGLVKDNGKVYPAKYQWISAFYRDVAIVKQNNFYGLINSSDEIVLPMDYDLIFHCVDDIYFVVKSKKYGYYSVSEKCFIYDIKWDYIKNTDTKNFTNGNYFKLIQQNKVLVGNRNGVLINKKPFQDALIANAFVFVKDKNKWAMLTNPDKINALQFIYYSVVVCSNQTLIAEFQNKFIILDNKGNKRYETIYPLKYIQKNFYFEEMDEDGKIIDDKGQTIISNVENYSTFDKYIIVTLKDKKIKVIH